MEEEWVRSVRSIAKRQMRFLIDGKIDDKNHLLLRTRDNNDVDAGLIRDPNPNVLSYLGHVGADNKPIIYITRDGAVWHAAASQGKFETNSVYKTNAGCWSGDRFLMGTTNSAPGMSTLLQSGDGGVWIFHPDAQVFNLATSNNIFCIEASGKGLVVAVGGPYFGSSPHSCIAISHDFGDTWRVVRTDTMADRIFDPAVRTVHGVVVRNNREFVISSDSGVYYTYDAGVHWGQVILPAEFTLLSTTSAGMRFFNEYWWFYGHGSGTGQWDTPLIKSKDLVNWEPVVTPWSGTYGPLGSYLARAHSSDSGQIFVLKHDPLSNVVLACGVNNATSSVVLMSTDGGARWFEIGYLHDFHFIADYGWDGVYKWPDSYVVDNKGNFVFAFDWWFFVNTSAVVSDTTPPLFRISLDGKTTEPVYISA